MEMERRAAGISERIVALIRDSVRDTSEITINGLCPVVGGSSRLAFSFDALWKQADEQRAIECILLLWPEASQLETSAANEFSALVLQMISAHFDERRRSAFLGEHEERMGLLARSIDRIRRHDPIVKSGDLMRAGIQPGKLMGELLSAADQIAINEQLHEPAAVIERLKQLGIWPGP